MSAGQATEAIIYAWLKLIICGAVVFGIIVGRVL